MLTAKEYCEYTTAEFQGYAYWNLEDSQLLHAPRHAAFHPTPVFRYWTIYNKSCMYDDFAPANRFMQSELPATAFCNLLLIINTCKQGDLPLLLPLSPPPFLFALYKYIHSRGLSLLPSPSINQEFLSYPSLCGLANSPSKPSGVFLDGRTATFGLLGVSSGHDY